MPRDRLSRSIPVLAALLVLSEPTSGFSQTEAAQDRSGMERCYGVVPAGENDGIDGRDAPGTSTVDYQGNAWVWVEAGTCLRMALPVQPDGSPRRGAIEPISRDRP